MIRVPFGGPSSFLDIQARGNSQREMLRTFASLLQEECNLEIEDCGGAPAAYLYLDDGIFTGNHIRNDINPWIQGAAPNVATVHVVTIALHRGGQYYAKTGVEEAAQHAQKKIDFHWWRCVEIEDRRAYVDSSDVLRPTSLPRDKLTKQYVQGLKYPPVLRKAGSVGNNKFFSSEEGRHLPRAGASQGRNAYSVYVPQSQRLPAATGQYGVGSLGLRFVARNIS